MGLIRAAVGAVGGTLSDSWLDYIRAENMTPTTILTKGEQVGKQHRRGSADIISNGSRIEVGANQMKAEKSLTILRNRVTMKYSCRSPLLFSTGN